MSFRTIEWRDNKVVMLDQTKLPGEEVYNEYSDFKSVAEAIRGMVIRGAPAIGVAAAMGIALGAREIIADTHESFFQQLSNICDVMAATRPTAVNLFWAIERMKRVAEANRERDLHGIREILRLEAIAVEEEDLRDLPRHRRQRCRHYPRREHRPYPLQCGWPGNSRVRYRPWCHSGRP